MSTFQDDRGAGHVKTTYRDTQGRIWAYRGKRALVLEMRVERSEGIEQWDTLSWQTRLGGTIHGLRGDGLTITTEIEGPFRHGRYRLGTRLVGETTPPMHRAGNLINNQKKSSCGPAGSIF